MGAQQSGKGGIGMSAHSDSAQGNGGNGDQPGTRDPRVLVDEIIDGTSAAALPVRLGQSLPTTLPILVSPVGPVYPGMMATIPVGDPRSQKTLSKAGPHVGILSVKQSASTMEPPLPPEQLYSFGSVARLVQPVNMPDGTPAVAVIGLKRMNLEQFVSSDEMLLAEVSYPEERVVNQREVEVIQSRVRDGMVELVKISPQIPDEIADLARQVPVPGALADFVMATLESSIASKQEILQDLVIESRLRSAWVLVEQRLDLARLGARIHEEIRSKLESRQREHYLREQLQAIRRELGEEVDQRQMDRDTYEKKIADAGMPEQAEERARRELERLTLLPPEASEYHVIRNYLDWLVELPWSRESDQELDISRAAAILDEDHHGLEEIKERILEFLAVRKLRQDQQGAILCLVGPPGVGKTSLGQSVARAMGREFHRITLGGMRDEAEIKGHRRTYVGAMPGKIIQALRRVKNRNPVFMLDELDKLGSDWRGDPSSALLEVLDPAQNNAFEDLYLDLPFDLSHVMFIATANMAAQIPRPLLDRMEVLTLSGYIPAEKRAIGRKYLLPRQLEAHGLDRSHLRITDKALGAIVDNYTREAGVRELERMIGRVCRKVAARVAALPDPSTHEKLLVTPETLPDYLGPRRHFHEVVKRCTRPGVVIGLAWTPVGGEVLFVEATSMPGKGVLQLTGKLGEVMSESARIAHSLLKSQASKYMIPAKVFNELDIHLHVPAGAIPKDGPSAGTAMFAALLSLLWRGKGKVSRARVAMTGEITLRGAVLPVGGIKEKVIGARRAGVRTVVLPEQNRPDVEEIPPEIVKGVKFIFASDIDDVVEAVLGPLPGKGKAPRQPQPPTEANNCAS